MAASSLNTVRVRLYFDYPPPGVSDCRMCWVLVDLNRCRVVADLASVIKEKFEFSRRTILNLFIDDCYLPPTESVYVVRDNDSIRVKVDNQSQVNGVESDRKSESLSGKGSKRIRETDDENEGFKTKKSKRAQTDSQKVDTSPVVGEEEDKKKKKKKKKKLKEKNLPVKPATPAKRAAPVKEPAVSKSGSAKTAKKPAPSRAAKPKVTSSSDSSDGSEEEPPKKVLATKAPVKRAKIGAVAVAVTTSSESSSDSSPGPAASRPVPKKPAPPTAVAARAKTRSSSSSSGSDQDPKDPVPKKPVPPTRAPPAAPAGKTGPQSPSSDSDSSSSSETRLVIKRPGLGHQIPPLATGPSGGLPLAGVAGRGGVSPRGVQRGGSPGAGRGLGRGNGRPPWRGGGPRGGQRAGRGRAGWGAGYDRFSDQNGLQQQQQQQQHADDTLTNKAVVLQNPPESAAPKRDYESLPLLAAPPQVGQRIAFKLLELTENYTPEVSDYKEGKIIGIDQNTKQIELELLSSAPAPTEPGKFDLVYQTADGSEVVEYAVSRTSQLTERWDSLLEPRLIVENTA